MPLPTNTILPNTRITPFPVRTPFFQGAPPKASAPTPDRPSQPAPTISFAHTKFLQSVADAANSAVQINSTVPANSSAPGEPGSIAYDASNLYVCVAPDKWLRFPGITF